MKANSSSTPDSSNTAPSAPPWFVRAALIPAVYGAAAMAWIYYSDRALTWFGSDPADIVRWSVYKGIGFVAVTTLLLLVLLLRVFRAIYRTRTELAAKEERRRRHEQDLERMSRLYAALSQVNQSIVWSKSRSELFRRVCHVLVDYGGFKMVWLGWHEPNTHLLEPMAAAGDEIDYLNHLKVYADERPEGLGPAGTAFRTGRAYICNDIATDALSAPWRDEALQRGIHSSAFFPIRLKGEVAGLLTVYAGTPGIFRDKEVALLGEAATDISFGLDNLALAAERAAAEAIARREQTFSSMMLESLPGILYFYDANGRFLRWNRSFERVSGYSADEIARMHPRDFFNPEDRPALEARIAEVFQRGESTVEAPFRTRDGTTLPYFFTGRRIEFEGVPCLVGVGIDITERRRAEEALEKSERRYRTTMDSILEGCQLIGFDWTYLYLNETASVHNRRANVELLGRRMPDVWPGIEHSHVFALLRRTMETRLAGHEETQFAFADGTSGWFDVRVQPVPEGIFVLSIDISERKKAEAELHEIQGWFQTVVENLREGFVITDPEAELLYWNPAALRLLGFASPEEGRRQQRDFGGLFTLSTLDGARLPPEQWPLARTRRGENFERLALRVQRTDMEWERVLSYTGGLIQPPEAKALAFLTIQDITQQLADEADRRRLFEQEQAARREAEHARQQVDHILESVTDAFVALDRDWRYVFVNDRAARIFNRRREDLIGKHIWTEFPEGVGQPFHRAYERAMNEQVEIQFEEYYAPYDTWFENRIYPSTGGISIVFQDISERKRAEKLLREANEQLEGRVAERTAELKAALMRAEAADRIKSAFLATMSHELRTPLNSIIGFTGIVLQGLAGPLNPEQTKQLGMVRGSARHLLELINDVLDLSKIEAGQLEVRKEPFDLARSIEHVVASVRPLADKKSLQLTLELSPDIGAIQSDRRRVEQILLNLVNNAIKFTDQGGVTLRARRTPAHAFEPAQPPRPAIEIAVTDTGIGIKPRDLASLFQPFRQIDSGLARQHEGTGLGLAICRRLATLLDGVILATSESGRGSTFTLVLPL